MKINHKYLYLKKFIVIFIWLFLLFSGGKIKAAEYSADFTVEYSPQELQSQLIANVNLKIKITHLVSDVFVKKFVVIFPKYFSIENLSANDDKGSINPVLEIDQEKTKVELQFNDPNTGKDSVNNLNLKFQQNNLFQKNGRVWEVILPIIEKKETGSYTVLVNLPQESPGKIAIAKPNPDLIQNNQIIWQNPKTKTIYAVFGEKQVYETKLSYHLFNPRLYPVETEIAFPPDTLYQQVFIKKIDPLPNKVLLDEDGNYLGRYRLPPTGKKTIVFKGMIVVYNKPRTDFYSFANNQFINQRRYLLTQKDLWQIEDVNSIKNLNSVDEIYRYVVDNLQYDYKKIKSFSGRLGAAQSLKNNQSAICTEFTDLFIAIAREKGIPSREIQGYGFSSDSQLRPLSLISDLLHSWPEYYHQQKKIWIPVDPTWENTSGIDYFTSFDLNHIVFVIHGKDPQYPLPAGAYKSEDSKDIFIQAVDKFPDEIKKIAIKFEGLNQKITDQKKYQGELLITNMGNTFVYQTPIKLKSANLIFNPPSFFIDQLAPWQTKRLIINYQSPMIYKKINTELIVFTESNKILTERITIIPRSYRLLISFGFLAVILCLIIFFLKRR